MIGLTVTKGGKIKINQELCLLQQVATATAAAAELDSMDFR